MGKISGHLKAESIPESIPESITGLSRAELQRSVIVMLTAAKNLQTSASPRGQLLGSILISNRQELKQILHVLFVVDFLKNFLFLVVPCQQQ